MIWCGILSSEQNKFARGYDMSQMAQLTCVKCASKFNILKSLRKKGLIWFCPFCKYEFVDDETVKVWE